jgi:hypothetical protein
MDSRAPVVLTMMASPIRTASYFEQRGFSHGATSIDTDVPSRPMSPYGP